MTEDQAKFDGWARVEVMGHQSHIGYVTTQAFGAAILFRIDQPLIPEEEITLQEAEWVGSVRAQAGSVVRRPEIPASSVLVGSGSIYRIIPCDEATALRAIRLSRTRPLVPVSLVQNLALPARKDDEDEGDEDDEDDVL